MFFSDLLIGLFLPSRPNPISHSPKLFPKSHSQASCSKDASFDFTEAHLGGRVNADLCSPHGLSLQMTG